MYVVLIRKIVVYISVYVVVINTKCYKRNIKVCCILKNKVSLLM